MATTSASMSSAASFKPFSGSGSAKRSRVCCPETQGKLGTVGSAVRKDVARSVTRAARD
jgi:hypothetical protein